ncbi:hypothetical protein LR48_Vigan10g189300 [Vigna angularis]|uniref:Putative plant transposon protein domain-containing protein n=1 Tax=Phaseolus angularis TaxID=3914 RepID=A0A0L9VLT0_PHAAN|nr:hypothetical protein LR48_Vigan10g189300 [Vigna angularis]
MSYVRGHTVQYDPDAIHRFLNTEWAGEQCQFALSMEEGANFVDVESVLCVLGGHFQRHRNGVVVNIRRADLTPLAKYWMTFSHANIQPCSHVSDITVSRALLLYCVLRGMSINIGLTILLLLDTICAVKENGTGSATEAYTGEVKRDKLFASVLNRVKKGPYITMAAEGFAGMTGLNASVRRLTEAVRSTTASVLQRSEVVRSIQSVLVHLAVATVVVVQSREQCRQPKKKWRWMLRSRNAGNEMEAPAKVAAATPMMGPQHSPYITMAAEGFAGMTGLNASVRRLTEAVRSTTASVLQRSEVVRSIQSASVRRSTEVVRSTTVAVLQTSEVVRSVQSIQD